MGRYKKEVKKVEVKKEEVIDENNLIITKNLDKYTRLLDRGYRLKEAKVDEQGNKTFVFYKN